MSINPGYKSREDKQMPFWLFATLGFLAVLLGGLLLFIILPKEHTAGKPYALKQNGDTLFIPTQVVIKHDTLVVIRTEERRPVADSLNRLSFTVSGGRIYSGGWTTEQVKAYFINGQKPYKQRDTIYEHKIIYY